ncbi:nitrate reductase cytochrome c-type subunit [Anaerobacillus sp. CMMVII]|uniref:nitrate reductase cytochrome c-type subunit n=1 Tax=Anaerobacillus sp. CMMVII TaxID=2755588 RepID=UPI0021B7D317|nr:nitrate reductase cytochrome c-type subunit [Anaerobacillus sp. CMMVII]MCT8138983.1 nitrate reductase cytochrome c-type subunit [Anaerobacillus sp. CMMVII]
MKKQNYFLFAVSLGIFIFAIVVGVALFNDSASEKAATQKQEPKQEQTAKQPAKVVEIPQLNQERAEAATMVLISAPTLQPVDHAGRWNPKTKGESCLVCHEQAEAMGARVIPIDHFVDQERSKGIFGPRYVCVTCHGLDTGETKAAFND